MFYPSEVLDEVRMGNDIVDVIGSFVTLKRSGASYMGLCPFHREKTPSFSVNRDRQMYHCFGCGASGNVYSFLMQHQNYSFQDAVKYLAERINYTLPEAIYSKDYEQKKLLRQRLYDLHKVAAKYFYERLNAPEGRKAVAYLDNRQVGKSARIKFGLGYAPASDTALFNKLKSEGFTEEEILLSGLVKKRDNGAYRDFFYNRLMFPIINVYGNIIAFGGRELENGKVKYLNSPDTDIFHKSDNFYNLNLARQSKMREYILVEGYMDVISVYQAGFHNVVAALGTAFNKNHAKTLKAYADSVILLFDSDNAGVNAVLRAIPVLDSAGIRIRVTQVTDAKDPDEFIKKFGPTAFGKLLDGAVNQYAFRIKALARDFDLSNNEDKIRYANEVARILSEINNPIEADVYIKEAAQTTGIAYEAIRKAVDGVTTEDEVIKPPVRTKRFNTSEAKGLDDARHSLLSAMISNPKVGSALRDKLNPEEFVDKFYTAVASAVYELMDAGGPVQAADVISRFDSLEEQQRVAYLFTTKTEFDISDNIIKTINDQLKVVKRGYVDHTLANTQDVGEIQRLNDYKKTLGNLNISL